MMAAVIFAGLLAAMFSFGYWVGYDLARHEFRDELERMMRRRGEPPRAPGD